MPMDLDSAVEAVYQRLRALPPPMEAAIFSGGRFALEALGVFKGEKRKASLLFQWFSMVL